MSRPIIVLEGFLGRDPEQKNDGKLVKFSVACQIAKEEVNWYEVAVWEEGLKQFTLSYLKKGSLVMVSGQQTVTEKDGKKYVNVNANSIQFVGGKKKEDDGGTKEEEPATETKKTDDVPF